MNSEVDRIVIHVGFVPIIASSAPRITRCPSHLFPVVLLSLGFIAALISVCSLLFFYDYLCYRSRRCRGSLSGGGPLGRRRCCDGTRNDGAALWREGILSGHLCESEQSNPDVCESLTCIRIAHSPLSFKRYAYAVLCWAVM